MDISSQLALLVGKELIFKWGEEGRELKGKISKIHEKHEAFTAEYYDPEMDAGAGTLVSYTGVARIDGNLVVFKK
jgi:ribosomal protein L35AE/L33A